MLQSALEVLDLPRNTVAQIARAFGVRPQSKRTFAGLPKITGQDILRHAGVLPSQYLGRNLAGSTADFLAGFLADVATDPLSWVTLGTSSLLGTGARRIGQTTLTRAGSKALEQRTARLLERVGRRAARGVADPDLAREAAAKARREWLERLGERPTREAWQAAAAGGDVEAAARLASRPSPLARRYLAGEGQRLLSERMAQRVARRPGMRDVTALGLSTRGVKEFQPFDLPAYVGTALTSLVSPRAGEALGRGYQAFRRVTGPVLNPLSWALPRADVTLLSREAAGRLGERLGLGRLGGAARRAIEASPLASAAARGLRTLGETLHAKFRTEPRQPRPGDAADQVRYEAEKFARFVDREVAARQQGILYDEPPKIRKWIDQATNISGAPRAAVADAIAEVAEMLPSLREGETSGQQIADAVRRTVRDYGGRPEQAEKLTAFFRDEKLDEVVEALAPEGIGRSAWEIEDAWKKEYSAQHPRPRPPSSNELVPPGTPDRKRLLNRHPENIAFRKALRAWEDARSLAWLRAPERAAAQQAREGAMKARALELEQDLASFGLKPKGWLLESAVREGTGSKDPWLLAEWWPKARAHVEERLKRAGAAREHVSKQRGRVSSVYYRMPDGRRIRVSDHYLPLHAERLYNQETFGRSYEQEIVLDTIRSKYDLDEELGELDIEWPTKKGGPPGGQSTKSPAELEQSATSVRPGSPAPQVLGGSYGLEPGGPGSVTDPGVRGTPRDSLAPSEEFGKFSGQRPPARELNLFGEPVEVLPEQGGLFSARELEAGRPADVPAPPAPPRARPVISDGLRSAAAQALREMPGRKLPQPKQLRKWLIERHGSGRLGKLLASPVYSEQALVELREAIEQAGKGRSLFGDEALAPLERKIGGRIKLVDSERFDYDATLRVVDADQLYAATGETPVPPGQAGTEARPTVLPSHRPKRDRSGRVVGFEPVAGYNAEAQARMPGERNAAVVAAIAREPRLEELNEFGTLVTDGPAVVYPFEPGRLHALAGNHRLMGMSLWDARQWKQQREFVEAAYGPLPESIRKPILVRELAGTPAEALRLAANSQEAPTARQSLIELANAALAKRGIARGDIDALPGVVIREPVSRDNVRALLENPANVDFRGLLFRGLSETETAKRLSDPEQLAETVNELFTAMLPRSVQSLAVKLPARYEPMFVAAAPLAAYLHSLRRAGLIRPEYDLYDALEQGAHFFERLTKKRGSYTKIIRELDEIAATPTFAGLGDELSRATQRGLAVAVGLVKAGRSKDPAGTFVTAIHEVIAAARADDPRQIGMFGIEPATAAAQSYLQAFVGGQQARNILDRMGAIRERELARGIGEGLGTGETPVPPGEPPAKLSETPAAARRPPAEPPTEPPTPPTAPPPGPPPSDRQQFLADVETYWRGRGLPEQQLTGVRAILEHMHDDVFRGLRLRAGSEAEAQALAARHGITPAASHTKLTAAEQVREKAQGLIRLFNRSRESDDMDLVLEELWHHVHNVILSDAERTGGRLAAYYARDPNELTARLFSDYVMGREIAAGTPEVRSIFARALDSLVKLWRQLTGAGLVDVSPRLEAIFSRYYTSPVAGEQVGARITGETPVPAAGRTPPPPGPPRPVRQPLLPGMETPKTQFGTLSREPIKPPAGPQGEISFPPPQPPGPKGTLVLADPVREAAEYIVARASQRIAEEQAADLPSARLTTQREIGYLMRFLVDDPKSNLGKLLRKAGIKLGSTTQLRRLDWAREKFTHELNQIVTQVNEVLEGRSAGDARAQQVIEALQLERGEQLPLYLMDPVLRHTARELESVRRIGSAEFLREIVRRHGVRIGQGGPMPPGYTKVETQQLGEWARDYAFPQEVARVLEQHVHRLSRPDPILRGYRTVLGLWKGWALVAPAYHLRNLLGNVWNMHLVDGFEPQAFTEARRMQRAIAAGDEATLGRRIKGTEESYGSLYRKLLVEHGLVASGFFGIELGVHLTRMEQLLEQMDNPTSFRLAWNLLRRGHPLKANQTLGQIAEEASRIALVIARLRKGDSLGQAVELTQRALFDYGDLTDFERGTHTTPGLRDVIPFYTWTRKNIGLLATMALAEPRKLAAVPKLQMGIEQAAVGEEALPDSLRPAHIAKEGGIQVTGGTRPRFVNLGYMLPVGELRLVNPLAPRQAARGWLEQAGGPARTALELATNYDTFFDRPIREYAGQRKEFLGLDVPPELKHVARTIRPLNQLEQFRRLAEGVSPAAAAGGIAANLAGVRAFPVDAGRQVFQAERTINEQLGAIRRDMRWRMRQIEQGGGDPAADGELKRLALEHERLRQQREQLPLAEQRALVRPLSRRRQEKLIGYLEQMQSQPN